MNANDRNATKEEGSTNPLRRALEITKHWGISDISVTRSFIDLRHGVAGIGKQREILTLTIKAEGVIGLGEAAPAWWIGENDLATSNRELQSWRVAAAAESFTDLFTSTRVAWPRCPAARAAIESATLDLLAKAAACPVAALLHPEASTQPLPLSRLLPNGDDEETARWVLSAREQGFQCVKLKVGGEPLKDRRRIDAALSALAPTQSLRLDANRAWTLSQATAALEGLDPAAIECVEEPLNQANPAELEALFDRTKLTTAIDESLTNIDQLDQFFGIRGVETFVLKPARLGGIASASAIARRIEEAGKRVMVTDSIEGATGSQAAVHLASACRSPTPIGLGGLALAAAGDASTQATATGPGLETVFARVVNSTPSPSSLDKAGASLQTTNASEQNKAAEAPTWLQLRAKHSANKPALVWQNKTILYEELLERASRAACGLQSRGITRGDRVAILAANSDAWAVAFHALEALGATLVPIGVRLAPAEIRHILRDAAPRLTLVDAQTSKEALPHRDFPIAKLEDLEQSPRQQGQTASLATPEDILAILYTSGTTGTPKGVVLTRANFEAAALASRRRLGHGAKDRWLVSLPLNHIGGLSMLVRAVLDGGCACIEPRFDAQSAANALRKGSVSIASFVATSLARTLEQLSPNETLPGHPCVLIGGGPIPEDLVAKARLSGCRVATTYGLTETCSQVATDFVEAEGPSGVRALPGTELRIDKGEILVRGKTVTPGYWRNPEATQAAFEGDWLRTGDLGELDMNGRLSVQARRSDLILSGGENVYPAEVERILLQHEAIAECVVFGREDPTWGQRVEAAYIPREGATVDAALLEAWCRERLAGFKRPRRFYAAKELPRTSAGKVRRHDLAATFAESA